MLGKVTIGRRSKDVWASLQGNKPERFAIEIYPESAVDLPENVDFVCLLFERGQKFFHSDASTVVKSAKSATFKERLDQETTLMRDGHGKSLHPKEWSIKLQKVANPAVPDPKRKTIAVGKLDLATYCSCVPNAIDTSVKVDCKPFGKVRLRIVSTWLSNKDHDACSEMSFMTAESATNMEEVQGMLDEGGHESQAPNLASPSVPLQPSKPKHARVASLDATGKTGDDFRSSFSDWTHQNAAAAATAAADATSRPGHSRSNTADWVSTSSSDPPADGRQAVADAKARAMMWTSKKNSASMAEREIQPESSNASGSELQRRSITPGPPSPRQADPPAESGRGILGSLFGSGAPGPPPARRRTSGSATPDRSLPTAAVASSILALKPVAVQPPLAQPPPSTGSSALQRQPSNAASTTGASARQPAVQPSPPMSSSSVHLTRPSPSPSASSVTEKEVQQAARELMRDEDGFSEPRSHSATASPGAAHSSPNGGISRWLWWGKKPAAEQVRSETSEVLLATVNNETDVNYLREITRSLIEERDEWRRKYEASQAAIGFVQHEMDEIATAKKNLQVRLEEAEHHLMRLRENNLIHDLANAKMAVAQAALEAESLSCQLGRERKRADRAAAQLEELKAEVGALRLVVTGSSQPATPRSQGTSSQGGTPATTPATATARDASPMSGQTGREDSRVSPLRRGSNMLAAATVTVAG